MGLFCKTKKPERSYRKRSPQQLPGNSLNKNVLCRAVSLPSFLCQRVQAISSA